MPRQPRERTKTFTGCWTCRSRKLKCDEQKPHCRQCTSKNLDCAGYGTRLRWLTPDSTGKSQLPSPSESGGFQRGNVCSNASIVGLGEAEINNALYEIELESPVSPDRTTCHGPFSVFCLTAKQETPPSAADIIASVPEAEIFPALDVEDCAFENALNDTIMDSFNFPNWTPKISEHEIASFTPPVSPRAFSLPDHSPRASSLTENLFSPSTGTSEDFTSYLETSLSNVSSPHMIRSRSPSLIDSNIFNRAFERSFMTPDVRYLLNHYMTQVINMMTVVSNTKSPWKSLHLPRALQGCGELEAIGTTSNARHALINALLAISAFNLSQKFRGGYHNSLEAEKWGKAAQKFRFRAVNLLKICLEDYFKDPSKVRYKEILAAMLSMVTIDVISGDTRTCTMHIAGCRSLIEASKQNVKRAYSTKARALHRVFLYLWIIQESTALSFDSLRVQEEDSDSDYQTPEKTANWLAAQQKATPELEDSTCELVYGVPQELFVLLGRTTALVRQIRSHMTATPNMALSSSLSEKCQILENEILEWPVDTILFSGSISCLDSDTQQIINHQTHSFHQAIIIFFSQHVRSIHRQHLQPYVRSVIQHLEAIEDIKQRIGLCAGPILWPGFIAASEALGVTLQDRFTRWFDNLEMDYGLGNVSAAKAVINEVWERRKGTEDGVKSDWRFVAESKKTYLMLS